MTPIEVASVGHSIEPGLRPGAIGEELSRVVRVRFRLRSAQHIRDLEVLHHQQVVTGREFAGPFVVKILAPVGDLTVPRRRRLLASDPVVGAAFGALQSLLRHLQRVGGLTRPARVLHRSPIGQRGERGDTDIDTRLGAGGRQRLSRHTVTGQHQHPSAALPFDLDRFHPAVDAAVQVHLHLADALQIHPAGLGQPTGAVTVFGPPTLSKRACPLKRGYPALVPGLAVLTRRKNPPKALFNRRNVAC
jgi:hypothetical protein